MKHLVGRKIVPPVTVFDSRPNNWRLKSRKVLRSTYLNNVRLIDCESFLVSRNENFSVRFGDAKHFSLSTPTHSFFLRRLLIIGNLAASRYVHTYVRTIVSYFCTNFIPFERPMFLTRPNVSHFCGQKKSSIQAWGSQTTSIEALESQTQHKNNCFSVKGKFKLFFFFPSNKPAPKCETFGRAMLRE